MTPKERLARLYKTVLIAYPDISEADQLLILYDIIDETEVMIEFTKAVSKSAKEIEHDMSDEIQQHLKEWIRKLALEDQQKAGNQSRPN